MDISERFKTAISEAFQKEDLFIKNGQVFQAMFETDLKNRLRDKGWHLPAMFLHEVKMAGFRVCQGFKFDGRVNRYYDLRDARVTGRVVSRYQTLVMPLEEKS